MYVYVKKFFQLYFKSLSIYSANIIVFKLRQDLLNLLIWFEAKTLRTFRHRKHNRLLVKNQWNSQNRNCVIFHDFIECIKIIHNANYVKTSRCFFTLCPELCTHRMVSSFDFDLIVQMQFEFGAENGQKVF